MIDILFKRILERFKNWLEGKPTGKFIIEFNINNGGIRGKPKITKKEDF